MAIQRVRRAADGGVATAVTSVIQNQKFKKMLIFGLRSLSDFCNPTHQLCLENALDALERNVVPSIVTAVENFADDVDLVQCASIILASMASGCMQEQEDKKYLKLLVKDGGLQAIEKILDTCPSEVDVLQNCFAFIEQLSALGGISQFSTLVGGMCKCLERVSLDTSLATKASLFFANTSSSASGCAAIKEHDGVSHLIKMCLALGNDQEACTIVEHVFKATKSMVERKDLDESCLDGIVKLIERHKNSRIVYVRGSEIIGHLISTAKLEKSLADLKHYDAGTPEHKKAINTLRCLSYISSVAEELAKTGAIVLLIDLIKKATRDLATAPEDMADVISGASRVVAAFSSNVIYAENVVQGGGVEALVAAMSACMEHPQSICAISDALTHLLRCGSEPFIRSNAIGVALPILYQLSENEDVAFSMMLYMVGASQLPELEGAFADNKVIEILCTCCQYHVANSSYQMSLIQTLKRFTSHLTDLATVYEYGGLVGISMALEHNKGNENYCAEVLGVLLTFAATPSAQQYMTAGDVTVTDAILEVMLEQSKSEIIISLAVKVLEIIVSENDVARYISELKAALSQSREDPDLCYKKLAAINGLYRITRLRQKIGTCGILPILMTSVSDWIEGDNFPNRHKLTRAAMQATVLVGGNMSECQAMISKVAELACLPQVKRMIDLEGPDDNFLLSCTNALDRLCAMERSYTPEECVETVESVLRVMKKYSDVRQAEASCLQTFNGFIQVTGKNGLDALVSTGAITSVVGYLAKVPMYVNCQLIGVALLLTCAQMDQSAVDCLLKCNTFHLLRMLNKMHNRVRKLKIMVGQLMTILMPVDAIEAEMMQLVADIEASMGTRDMVGVHSALVCLNQLLVSKEAVRIASRNNLVACITKTCDWVLANATLAEKVLVASEDDYSGKNLVDACLYEMAQINYNICQTRIGLVYLTRQKHVALNLKIYENLKAPVSSIFEDAAVSSLEGMTLLFLHDRANVENAVTHDFLAKICQTFQLVSKCPSIIRSICKCLAAICTTPGRVGSLIATRDFVALIKSLVANLTEEDDVQIKYNSLMALWELIQIKNEQLLDYFGKETNIVAALYDVVELHYNNAELMTLAAQCLVYLGAHSVITNPAKLSIVVTSINKALIANKNNAECCAALLNLLVLLANKENKELLKQCGIMETVSDVMMVHSEVDEVTQPGGVLFGIMGAECQIRALMRNVIDVVERKEETMPQQVDKLCIRLAMYLLSPLDNRQEALADTEEFFKSLNTCMAFAANNQNLMANASLVSRRLCDQVFNDPEDQFGAWAVASSGNLQQLIAILNTEYGAANVKFLCNAYRVFSACVVNPYTSDVMQSEAVQLMPITLGLLERYKANADAVHAIFEFLSLLAKSPATATLPLGNGAQIILASKHDMVAFVTDYMINHKNSDAVVIPAMDLCANLIDCGTIDTGSVSNALEAAERVCMGEVSDERKLAYMNLAAACMRQNVGNEKTLKNIMMLLNSASGSFKQSSATLGSFAALVLAAAGADLVGSLFHFGAIKMLLEMSEDTEADVDTLIKVIRGLHGCIVAHPEGTLALLKDAMPRVLVESACESPEYGHALCDLLLEGTKTKGVGQMLDTLPNFQRILGTLMELARKIGDADLESKLNNLLDAIAKDRPIKRTCQTVYTALDARKIQNKTLDIAEAIEVADDAQFLLDTMEDYTKTNLSIEKEEGKDAIYGCMAFSLLYSANNCGFLIDNGLLDILLSGLQKQRDVDILNEFCACICAGCQVNLFVSKLLTRRDAVRSIGAYLDRVHYKRDIVLGKDFESDKYEFVIINSMLLVERTAVNRKIYLSTKVTETIIEVWNSYDKGDYKESRLLRQTFRSLRKIVAEQHLELLLRCNMIARIKHIFATTTDVSVIPDALFLAGSLAVVQTIKNQICEQGMINSILDLMHKHVGNESSPNAIITNTCLALANACIGHKPSSECFVKLKGPEMNVRVLQEYRKIYEITNGASILLCNLLYKNDNLKEYYGKIGAPAALVECLKAFAGSNDPLAIRCIESLFKAISNLALYADNVGHFIEAGIEQSFHVWLKGLNKDFSNEQLKVGLQTLSNLVMDNREEYMQKFGICLIPILSVLAQDRNDSRVALLLFDILGSLCRFEPNAKLYLSNGGVERTMSVMRKMNYDSDLITLGIHLLSMQASSAQGTTKLLEMDVYSLLLSTLSFEGQGSEIFDIIIASLRCIRKLFTSAEMVYLFCSQDGLSILVTIAERYQTQPGIVVESFRLLLGMLDLTRPMDDSEAPAWENIGMTKDEMTLILKVACVCGSMENCLRMARLQRIVLSIASYFLSNSLGSETLMVNGLGVLVDNALVGYQGNLEIFLLVTVLLENCFMIPQDVRNNLITRDLLKRYKDYVSKIPTKRPEDKTLKARGTALVDALAAGSDAKLECTGTFDFQLSEWNVDPYPHGTHDLPEASKAALRKGDRLKAFLHDSKTRVGIRWRASQDLNCFEWGPEEEDFPYRVAIRRIRNIARGLKHPTLEAANQREPRKVTAANCFCIFGSPTEDFPEGLVVPIKCKSNKERDAIVELLVQWRDAASYNF
ncbi:bifunctional Armadillo-type fold/Armadillo-like helical/Armadillo repeat-containing protein 6/Armadillo [Babesia duncani]|uniref:Bifunctional Armadillo-type fold/Armadillo-like helical/Armadillo repeat-containing protein 6/Armadillo n=1 Tax=Babesia duncani TaxID=323732 RepID=A0AAD9UPR9_9APIC|nr:bifunctional Armadillo-type fold/Armadillo-like helical/Armadillo repeat-containing protein 6/Armadillo [Babesia duncani]